MKIRVAALAFCLVAIASAAQAQLRAGTVEINPYAGWLFGGNFGDAQVEFTPFRVGVDDDAVYGGRLGFNATSLFEFELEYAYFKTQFEEDPCCIFVPPPQGLGDLKIQYFMGYATFNFGGTSRFIPYFTVGAGAANLDPDVPGFPNLESDTRFTAGIGGGVKWFFTPNFALRFDGRLYSTYLGSTDVLCGWYYVCTVSNWLTNGGANGGIIVAF
jgi:opacity protein-like surface antigen